MKKTISQRFFLSLCLMIVGCLWGSAAWAETVTYTVTSTTEVSITSGTAPSGSIATYSSTYATTAQLAGGKSMTLTLSGYAGKKITGITLSMKSSSNSGAGYLSVKAGTTTLASIGSPSSGVKFNNSAWYGKWSRSYVNVTPTMSNNAYAIQNNEDVVILIGATASSLYCQSFTLTYEDAGPTLLVPSEPISFGDIETGYNDTKTFSISGMKLTADATLEITGTNAAMFSVSPTTITATDGNIAAKDVTVTYTPTTTGTHSATLTISSGDLSREVSLSGTGIEPLPHYTVSWMVNGETYTEGTPSTDVAEGGKVKTLPTNPANIGSNVFMGWTASEISETPAGAPADLFTTAKDAPVVTGETTYYAVFAEATANGTHWEEIKALPEPGRYAILSDSYFMSSTISSNRFKNGSTTPQISGTTPATLTAAPSENCIWEFTKPDSYYRIANGGKYAGGTSSNKQGAMLSEASNNYAKWTIEYINSSFTISNYGRNTSEYNCLRNNDSYGWACYKSSTGKAPRLFKETTSYTYSNYATTIVVKEEAGLAFEKATYIVDMKEIITVTATNASGATITYSVDDDTHAMVDENGKFMADAVGTYTITATCPATKTHSAGMTTCQVIVTQPSGNIHATTYYKQITSSDELADGGQYVIVYTTGKKGLLADANNVHDATPADVVFEGNGTITTANAAAMTEITFEHNADAKYYLSIGNSKYIKAVSVEDLDLKVATEKDNNALWTIGFDGNGNVEITSVAFTNRGIMYSTSSTGFFKNYAVSNRGKAGYPAIQLYQKVGEMPIAKATGYVSTYVADFAYVMPKHITGHTVALADKKDVIITEKAFRAGDEVPALTPLLIKSDEDYAAEETSRNYNPAVLNKTVDAYTGANMLEYRRTAENYTNTMKNGNVYYYKLAIKEGNVGFYWGAADGAAFIMTKPSTAYLTVPQTIKVQGFVLNLEEGATTDITTVVTNEDAPIYNLQGIRMNGKNLPKGIYIQGGKKFMVK